MGCLEIKGWMGREGGGRSNPPPGPPQKKTFIEMELDKESRA